MSHLEVQDEERCISKPEPLPEDYLETTKRARLECSVRNFLLRSACRTDCFYTTREVQRQPRKISEWWIDSSEERMTPQKQEVVEKHYVSLPSIIFSNSSNPRHRLHISCLICPPLDSHEKAKLKFEEEILQSIER